ncbi:unnamed protein product [Victoria cruziana]
MHMDANGPTGARISGSIWNILFLSNNHEASSFKVNSNKSVIILLQTPAPVIHTLCCSCITNLLWDEDANRRHAKLVAWNILAKPKSERGVGLLDSKELNSTFTGCVHLT